VDKVTSYDNGNYTCVPSYAIPDWTRVEILNGKNVIAAMTLSRESLLKWKKDKYH
jgi:hypothetical protein